MKRKIFSLFLVCCMLCSSSIFAQITINSVAAGPAQWDDEATWDCNCIPSALDDVIINTGHVVGIRDGITNECNSLTIDFFGALGDNGTQISTLNVRGDLTINSGILDISFSKLVFKGTSPQTLGGTPLGSIVGTLEINNSAGVTLGYSFGGGVGGLKDVNLVKGTLFNSNNLYFDNASYPTVITRGGDATASAGSFDVAPTFSTPLASNGIPPSLKYLQASTKTVTGFELALTQTINLIPISIIVDFEIDNTNGVDIQASRNIGAIGNFTFTNGTLNSGTFGSPLMGTVGQNLDSNPIYTTGPTQAAGNTSSYVNGPFGFTKSNPSSLDFKFPIGDAMGFRPIQLNGMTWSNSATVGAQAVSGSTSGTLSGYTFSNTRYWQLSSNVAAGTVLVPSVTITYGMDDIHRCEDAMDLAAKTGTSPAFPAILPTSGAYTNIGGTVMSSNISSGSSFLLISDAFARPTAYIAIVNNTDAITPMFTPIADICLGGTFTLPTISNNGIAGTWSPLVNNTTTTTYTFTPDAGQCATTASMTVNVNPEVTPTFTQVSPICAGGSFTLPNNSTEGVMGTWTPSIDNANTTTYTFTPNMGQCATTTTMEVVVNPNVTPMFTQVAPICSGGSFTLPSTSNNSVTGTWLPAIDNMNTTTYTFTPGMGQCATTATMIVTVNACAGTQLISSGAQNSCGKTYKNFTDKLYYTLAPGAISYDIEFTNGVKTFTKTITATASNWFDMTGFSPALAYGATYTARMRVTNGSGTGSYGPACNVTIAVPQLVAVSGICGKTYTNLAETFNVFKYAGITQYKFIFKDALLNTSEKIVTAGTYGIVSCALDQLQPAISYDENFSVEVYALYTDVNGNPAQGTVFQICNVSTLAPISTVAGGYCNKTYTSLDDKFVVFPVSGATSYRFTFTDLAAPGTISTVSIPQPAQIANQLIICYLNQPSPALNYNRNYSVSVEVEYNNGVFGPATNCNVQIEKPLVQTANYCGKVYTTLTNQVFSVFKMSGVTQYRFVFTDKLPPFNVTQIIVPQSAPGSYGQMIVSLSNPALALQMNHNYEVDVYATYNDLIAGPTEGTIFANCSIGIGVPAKKGDDSIEDVNSFNALTVYPNPSNGVVTLSGTQNFENASVRIFNSLGQVVLSKENVSGNDLNFDFSNNTSGMYILEFNQNGETSRIKLIKE